MKDDNRIIEEAIAFALQAHGGAKRKGKDRPYILHPIEAMTVVAGMTDDAEVIAAAVLHDTLEDTDTTEEELITLFGERTAAIVVSESENKRAGIPADATWQVRKQETVDHLRGASPEAKLVCLGDKLSNLREIARDYAQLGDALWSRFNQTDKIMIGWYYSAVFDVLKESFGYTSELCEYEALLSSVFGWYCRKNKRFINKANRDLLERARTVLETVEEMIETVMEEEQAYLDSLPKNDDHADVIDEAASAVEQMEEAAAAVGDAIEALASVLG